MHNYVLLITIHADPAMPPGYGECGGTQTYMKELLDEFGKLGICCVLFTRKSMSYLPSEEQYNATCKVIRLINGDEEPMSKLLLYQYHEQNLKAISDYISSQEELPTVIHSVYWNSGRLALELSERFHIPFVHSVISNSRGRINRGAYEPIPQRAEYEQNIYSCAQKILCVSEDEKNDLIKFYHISSDKLVVCGQYVDAAFICPSHNSNGYPHVNSRISDTLQEKISNKYNDAFDYISKEKFWLYKAFTYFGRLDLSKGILQIIDAWYICYKHYNQYCPPLWIVGGSITDIDAIRTECLKTVPELSKLEQMYKIVWWGYLNTQGLSTVLLKTQVVLMHSLYEPGGRVVVEAMSEGIPVIGTSNGFAKDIIEDWQNGFLVQYGDVKSLSERIEHFIRQPILSNLLGQRARKDAKNIIQSWNFIKNHLNAYGLSDKLPLLKNETATTKNNTTSTVNIFPYLLRELSDEYVKQIFYKFSHDHITRISSADKNATNTKYIETENDHYIMEQITPKMSLDPLYNPFAKEYFVTDIDRIFNTEVTMRTRMNSVFYFGNDPFHHLLFYKQISKLDCNSSDFLQCCLHHLLLRPNVITEEEQTKYLSLLDNHLKHHSDITNLFRDLENAFPNFNFPHSGIFSASVAWAIAPHILAYNVHILEAALYAELLDVCLFFGNIDYETSRDGIRNILPCVSADSFFMYGDDIELNEIGKSSIGDALSEIGVFLYNYCKKSKIHNICEISEGFIHREVKSLKINPQSLFPIIAYCLFLDIIITVVVDHKEISTLLQELKSITNEYERINK